MSTTTDNRIYFEDTGSGVPIIFGHSFLCNGDMWREQTQALEDKYRLINVDFRGHGQSAPVREPFTIFDAVDDVVAVLDDLGIERAIWCGLSIGGMVALRAALTVPERISALVIMDSHAGEERALRKLKYRLMALGTRAFGTGPFLSPICKMMFGTTTRRDNPALVSEWREVFANVDIPSILRGLDGLVGRDSIVARLPEIAVPTLVIVGEEDTSLPPAFSQEIDDGLPNSKFVRIPGAGHLSALEQPTPINDALDSFLQQVANS